MEGTVTIPISARVELQPDGQFKMVTAEYTEVPVSAVATLLYPAYAEDKRRGIGRFVEHSKGAQ